MSSNVSIEGVGSIASGEYDNVEIDGVGKLKGDAKCSSFEIDGVFKGKGKIEADTFTCNGVSRVFRNINAKTINNDGFLKVRRSGLYAGQIYSNGVIICNREVSADNINLEGYNSIARIYGDKVTIKFNQNSPCKFILPKKLFPFMKWYFGRKVDLSYSIVDYIECTELYADNLKAKSIKAGSVTLGENCIVDNIECTGNIEYDSSCIIGKADSLNVKINNKEPDKMPENNLTKILDMYKDGKINPDEAEKLINALKQDSSKSDSPSFSNPSFGDNKLRIVVYKGNKLITQHDYRRGTEFTVDYQGDACDVECWGSLSCKNVSGSANAGTSIKCGNVGSKVNAGTNIECGDVNGSINAGTNVTCGDVSGNVSAGTSVSCGVVKDDINAGTGVHIKR